MSDCFFIGKSPEARIVVAYTCAVLKPEHIVLARHFLDTYRQFPGLSEHEAVVICNGGNVCEELRKLFDRQGFRPFVRSNDGWDIGGYLELADVLGSNCDLLVCFGDSTHFHRAGWLKRLEEAEAKFGPGMYGCFSSYLVRAHLNTTGFAINPKLLWTYPPVHGKEDRYHFEHGPKAIWRRVSEAGYPVKFVNWSGFWDLPDWRWPENILWSGDQSDLLVWNHHTDQYFGSAPAQKKYLESAANYYTG